MALNWAMIFGAIAVCLVGIPSIVLFIHLNRINKKNIRASE